MSKDEKRKKQKQKDHHHKQSKYKYSKMGRVRTEMYEKEQSYKSPKRMIMKSRKEKKNELSKKYLK